MLLWDQKQRLSLKINSFKPFIQLYGENSFNELNQLHITIIGLGGLGQPLLLNLVHSGLKKYTLYDADFVSETNLHRQFLSQKKDIGTTKLSSIKKYFFDFDLELMLVEENWEAQELKTDLIIDCTDDPLTRLNLNRYSQINKIPYLFVSANAWDGQVALFTPQTGCLECVFPHLHQIPCEVTGVSIATTQAIAALATKVCLDYFQTQKNHHKLYHLSLDNFELNSFTLKKSANCYCQKRLNFFSDLYVKEDQCDSVVNLEIEEITEGLSGIIGIKCQNGIKARRTLIQLRAKGLDNYYLLRE